MGLFKNTGPFSKYVSPLTGSDSNGGTITSPYATINKAGTNSILLNGKTNENVLSVNVTGDGPSAEITGTVGVNQAYYMGSTFVNVRLGTTYGAVNCFGCVVSEIKNGTGDGRGGHNMQNSFIGTYSDSFYEGEDQSRTSLHLNNTIFNFNNYQAQSTAKVMRNNIFINCVDLYNYSALNIACYPIFKYCLFRKATVWKWNGVTIPINYGNYGNTAGDYMADVISGLYAFANSMVSGQDKNYFLAMIPSSNSSNIFYVDVNGQTCKVVEDRPSIPGSKKIFNRYVNDSPVDYSLFLSSDNVALTMSDQLSYVGCYKANTKVLTFGEVMHVNADGSDDLATVPDMLISDSNGKFHVSTADSVQIRNRVRSDVFNFKRGFNLTAFQSQIKSGLGSRFSMGKFQPYNITDAPTLPQESIEILPYDDENTPSAFPRFSGMFNGECKMWYHTTGAKINQPVLFNDLQSFFAITTDKSLAEYGTWAVTNADFETYLLSSKTGVTLRNIPVYYCRIELNLNYHI